MAPELTTADFSWSGYFWTAATVLESWRGFQSRGGAYASQNDDSPSDGQVRVIFAPEGRDDSPLRDDELAMVNWALKHQEEVRDAFLQALLAEYPSIRAECLDADIEDEYVPEVAEAEGFRDLLGLGTLTVHQLEHEGLPYVGLLLGCEWDAEHGLGALLHGTRVVAIGGADTAIYLWMAEQDAEKSDGR